MAVEAALVLPVVMLLVFGMIDMSLLLRDYVSITAATRSGTRIATAQADAGPCGTTDTTTTCTTAQQSKIPGAVQSAADAMVNNLNGVPATSINYVLIYEANKYGYPCVNASTCNPTTSTSPDTSTTMPSTCTGYVNCDMFTWSATANSGAGALVYSTGSWNSASIEACVNKEDYIGVYVNLTHKWITGILGPNSITMADKSVMQFEPLSNDTCDSNAANPHT